jgi:predicted DNA-binding transcriptional regulator YafY
MQAWCGLRNDWRAFWFSRVLSAVPGPRLSQEDPLYWLLDRVMPQARSRVNNVTPDDRSDWQTAASFGFQTT